MANSKYTAQEMREMADAIINECEDEEAGLVYESPAKAGHIFYPDEASAMLRQAAEIRERLDESIDDPNGIDLKDYDYILHGEE